MTKRARLYPSHQHQWTELPEAQYVLDGSREMRLSAQVRCIVCGFTVPRNLAQLDGTPAPKETR